MTEAKKKSGKPVPKNFVEGRDDTSGLPYLHLTFFMHSFIPRRYVETLASVNTATVVGAYAERLKLPSIVSLGEDGLFSKRRFTNEALAVFLHTKDIVLDFPREVQSDHCNYVISTENVHTGYCRLKMLDNVLNAENKEFQVVKKGVSYLGSSKSLQKFLGKIKANKQAISDMLDTLINHGESQGLDLKFSDIFSGVPEDSLTAGKRPHTTMGLRGAITNNRNANAQQMQEKSMGIIRDVEDSEVVHILAFHVDAWPPEAHEWQSRARPHGWPPSPTISRVVKEGFHVVPVKHKDSKAPEIEWKYSFDLAIKTLLIEGLGDNHRQLFLFFHLLCLHALSECFLMPSHVTVILLHALEQEPQDKWCNNPVQCSLALLDRLINAVHEKSLPCYFIKANNLFDHMSDLELSKLERRLQTVRKKPLEELLSLTDHYTMLDVFPYNLDIRKVMSETLKDSKSYQGSTKAQTSLEVFMRATNSVVNSFYHEFAFDHCCSVLDDLVDYIVEPVLGAQEAEEQRNYIPHLLNQRNIEFSNELHPSDIWKAVSFGRYIIRRYDNGNLGPGLHLHLACLYHAAAHIFPSDRLALLEDADKEFAEALKLKGRGEGPGMQVEYCQFLISCERYKEAVPLLREVVKTEKDLVCSGERESKASINYYGRMESFVMDPFLRQEIELRGYIEVWSCLYSYYLLLEIYIKVDDEDVVRELFTEMEAVCSQVNDAMSYALLGYAAKKKNDKDLVIRAFQKVLELEPRNPLAVKALKAVTSPPKGAKNGPSRSPQNTGSNNAAMSRISHAYGVNGNGSHKNGRAVANSAKPPELRRKNSVNNPKKK